MRTIVAGSRTCNDYDLVKQAIENSNFNPTVVISGTAMGVDQLGERWAKENNIAIERFPAQWDKYGKSAGYKRNTEMALKADALIAIWFKGSRGTKHMIEIAKKFNLKIFIYTDKENE
jgi:predicted double-glycine peptidase